MSDSAAMMIVMVGLMTDYFVFVLCSCKPHAAHTPPVLPWEIQLQLLILRCYQLLWCLLCRRVVERTSSSISAL